MGAARVKKKARKKTADETPVPLVPQPHGGALLAGGVPGNKGGSGRPPAAFRVKMRDLLADDGVEVAREILRGNPDQSGKVPDHALRVRLLGQLTEIGFDERMRTERLRADATAAANAGPKAMAGVQLILQGGPAGNLKPDSGKEVG